MKRLGLPRRLAVGVVVMIAAGALAGFAAANNRPAITFVSPPSPTEGQTVTTSSVQFAFTYNRQPKATASLECDLSGPTSSSGPCDTPVSSGKQQSSSGASYSSLANGGYTFTVTLTLTDGGTTTAVRHFTVNACTAGSENFSEDADGSQPTTFSGGTIDSAGYADLGGIYIEDTDWFGFFAPGTHILFGGFTTTPVQLSFTQAVDSVQLQAQSNDYGDALTVTLTGYDASNNVVDSDSQTVSSAAPTLNISSTTNSIKYFTVATSDPFGNGVGFSNINWGCN